MTAQPTISLCMIVKNEQTLLPGLLSCVRDSVDEMIIVDTGSTDQTKAIAIAAGAKVFDFTWQDDFAAARNQSLQYATKDWILVLDADERITADDLHQMRQALIEAKSDFFELRQINYTHVSNLMGFLPNTFQVPEFQAYAGFTESWLARLFRRKAGFAFTGAVHEHLALNGKILEGHHLGVNIHHHGLALSEEKMREKKARYLALAQKKVSEQPNDFKAWHELGVAAFEMKSYEDALNALHKALSLKADYAPSAIAMGAVCAESGQPAKAQKVLQEMAALCPNDGAIHGAYGANLLSCGEFEAAVSVLIRQIEINAEMVDARRWLASAYAQLRQNNPARRPTLSVCYIVKNEDDCLAKSIQSVKAHADEVIVMDTGSTDKTRLVAKENGAKVFECVWQDDFAWARNQSLKHATSEWILILDADEIISPTDWPKIELLMQQNRHEGYSLNQTTYSNAATFLNWRVNDLPDPEAAGFEGYFESPLVRLFKNTPDIFYTGSVHEHAGHVDGRGFFLVPIRIHHYGKYRAPERLEYKSELYHRIGKKKLVERPSDAHAHHEMGVQLMELKRDREAEDYFKKCLALDPNHLEARLTYACLLHRQERYQESLDQFMALLKVDPNNARAYVFLSSLLIDLKRYDVALNFIARAKELGAKKDVALLINEGVLHMRAGRDDEARISFNEALVLNENFGQILLNLGLIEARNKNYKEAKSYLERAIKNEPKEGILYRYYGEILFNMGEAELALTEFKRAYDLNDIDPKPLLQGIIAAHFLHRPNDMQALEIKLLAHPNVSHHLNALRDFYKQINYSDGLQRIGAQAEQGKVSY